jgi:hypothetical protein
VFVRGTRPSSAHPSRRAVAVYGILVSWRLRQ